MQRQPAPPLTSQEYAGFEGAYEWFNQQLFGAVLPPCLITLQRKAKSYGYFARDRFGHRRDQDVSTDELALNPDTFAGRSDKEILSTLVHEMCHVWQHHCGAPSRTGYHNKAWAAKMAQVGLVPSDTGAPGGKQTGQHMTHYIQSSGPFAQAADALLGTGFRLNWQSAAFGQQTGGRRSRISKVKYQCPSCGQNAWAKPEAHLLCGACLEDMEAQDHVRG